MTSIQCSETTCFQPVMYINVIDFFSLQQLSIAVWQGEDFVHILAKRYW